ncbi:MAG: PatB family C-S lyase [Chloroflexota bacterium]
MTINFDNSPERRGSDSSKWTKYGPDVLPMWVADMDFPAADVILDAVHKRVSHGFFGYGNGFPELKTVICERMKDRYDWDVMPDQVILYPGVISGFNSVHRAVAEEGDGVLVQTPMYPPILGAPKNHAMQVNLAELALTEQAGNLRYEIDFDAFEAAITPQTSLFLLCHPHNPIGRSYTPDELTRMAEICLKHDVVICSDEIHCELMMDGLKHTPMASLSEEIGQRCITLMAPSKTFNLPGLGFSFAIIQNPELYAKLETAKLGIVPHYNVLGATAATAAYTQGSEWHEALLAYLLKNRDTLVDFVNNELPGVRTTVPEATYLGWLDCRESGIDGDPFEFFLDNAKVALNAGPTFGTAGDGFVRLNFGCPRERLLEGLNRMKVAMLA